MVDFIQWFVAVLTVASILRLHVELLVSAEKEMKTMGSVPDIVMPRLLDSFPCLFFERQSVPNSVALPLLAPFDFQQIATVLVLVYCAVFKCLFVAGHSCLPIPPAQLAFMGHFDLRGQHYRHN